MVEDDKNYQLSDDELEDVSGGREYPLRKNGRPVTDQYGNALKFHRSDEKCGEYNFYCHMCKKIYSLSTEIAYEGFRYCFGTNSHDPSILDIYCPFCIPDSILERLS